MIQYAYLFEARGIQRFLFASGKLRDMLGGSELLDYLCADDGLLDQTLNSLDLQPKIVRKAGGSFYLLFERREDAVRLRAAWRLACGNWLPGVEQIDALSEGRSAREAMDEGLKLLRKARNRLCADLPRPGPLSERSPRTGLAAVLCEHDESLDAATARQRRFERPKDQNLAQRFLDEDGYLWPINFEEDAPASERFPLGERHLVGLLHADGNGLGELLRVLTEACKDADDATYVDLYRAFSDGLMEATLVAARQACLVLLPHACDKVLPARPLVLGGDDLTILVRADLALPFAKAFLAAFETHSRSAMTRLHKAFEDKGLQAQGSRLPAHLTACAGLCYMKCSHPFQAGHELAEGLCKRAKVAARQVRGTGPIPATLALHKVQDSLLEDAETQFEQNYCVVQENGRWQLALPVYALKPVDGLPALEDLERLLDVFGEGLNDRPLRELATLLHGNPGLARQAYQRWRELAQRKHAAKLAEFDNRLRALLGPMMRDLPFSQEEPHQTPLADVLSLLTVQGRSPQPQERHQ
ncbi:MAG: hypothetical protein RBR77_13070 [Thauera sp.]|nr:hypothetical protein [Thauera sp.]